jgi:hypothetical protein
VTENQTKTIPIFEVVEVRGDRPVVPGERPIHARVRSSERAVEILETGVDVLSKNMASFVDSLTDMLSASVKVPGPFDIDTVEVECQVNGSGKIGLPGTVALQGGANATMRLVFKKRQVLNEDALQQQGNHSKRLESP